MNTWFSKCIGHSRLFPSSGNRLFVLSFFVRSDVCANDQISAWYRCSNLHIYRVFIRSNSCFQTRFGAFHFRGKNKLYLAVGVFYTSIEQTLYIYLVHYRNLRNNSRGLHNTDFCSIIYLPMFWISTLYKENIGVDISKFRICVTPANDESLTSYNLAGAV